MTLPVRPPIKPMLALLTREIPAGDGWLFEPKWDGFRALVFRDEKSVFIQSRDLKPLNRYFPELEKKLMEILPSNVVLDGEIVIAGENGLDFDSLLLRIHPAASRIAKLSKEIPASFVAFDVLAQGSKNLMKSSQQMRRKTLERVAARFQPPVFLTPATLEKDQARDWFTRFEGAGLDGVVAKKLTQLYMPGERVMLKIKHQRTVDCVVGGFRWYKEQKDTAVGSLLLGLYDKGILNYVGHASNFQNPDRRRLVELLNPLRNVPENVGFGKGRTPGGISRWTQGKDVDWERIDPKLVCEVSFDHLQGSRFRHAASFLRWRPDKKPRECTFDQIQEAAPFELQEIFSLKFGL